jgi:hypothetical protein
MVQLRYPIASDMANTNSIHASPLSIRRFLRARRRRAGVALALTIGFLFQPVLTYLVTPMVGYDAEGNTVVEKCSLMGVKRLSHHVPLATELSSPVPKAPDEPEDCPALTLYNIAGTAQIALPPTVVTLPPRHAKPLTHLEIVHLRTMEFTAYAPRAPPPYS